MRLPRFKSKRAERASWLVSPSPFVLALVVLWLFPSVDGRVLAAVFAAFAVTALAFQATFLMTWQRKETAG